MSTLSRRAFLATAAAAPLAASAAIGRPIDPIARTRPSHLKLSLAAYSFRDRLTAKPPTLDLFGFADLAADWALDAIEPTGYYFPPDVDDAYLNKLKTHAFLLGLDVSGTAIGNNFCVADGPERDKQVAMARTWIDRAAVLGAPVIRVFAGNTPKGDSEDDAVQRAIAGLNEVLPYAAEKGVILALENHGGITATPKQLLRLVEAIESPNFGVNLDTGNFRTDDPYADLAELAPYAVNVQVKTEITRKGKKEEADLSRFIEILRDAKYSGYVALEYEAADDPMTAVPGYLKKLRELIG